MKHGLEHAVGYIKEKGLPSADRMRADIAGWEAEDFQDMIQKKLHEYRVLFNRFKAGEN